MGGQQYQLHGFAPIQVASPYGYGVHGGFMSPQEQAALIHALRAQNSGVPPAVYATMGGYRIGADAAAPSAVVVPPNPLVPGAFGIDKQDPTERRQLMLGFDSVTDVAAGTTVNVPTTVQDVFRGNRLVIPGSIAQAFIINDIRIGTKSQLSSVLGMPAEAFVPEALSPIRLDTAQIGQQITINLTNRSAGPMRFLATLYGDAAR